jgi:broad specificity phosphatase PhoE
MAHIELPLTYLARHGETAWSLSGQHTGLTDLPLTEVGEGNARRLRDVLTGLTFAKVFSSPLRRAWRTCELAGHGARAEIVHDLVEWDYGEYEGRRTVEIHAQRPDWQLFRDGCPGGESPQDVAVRADRVVELVRSVSGNVLLFSSGHFLRMLAARWTGIDTFGARSLMLSTASLSVLGYEHLKQPAIQLWNDTHHLLSSKEEETRASCLSSSSRKRPLATMVSNEVKDESKATAS